MHAAEPDIVRKYAPTINQGIGPHPAADEFTRVDFDGDWNPENNWDHLEKFPRPRTVYWDVTESETRYFITYAFFFPRDYADWCFFMHCHENDFEGMRVVVKKPDQIEKVEALAHNFKSEVLSPVAVNVRIESRGHGVYPLIDGEIEENHRIYTPLDYTLRPLSELWEKKNSGIFTGAFQYNGKTYPSNFGGSKWLLFGIGAAKPAWSWEIWKSDYEKGQWFLDPLKGTKEKYIRRFGY